MKPRYLIPIGLLMAVGAFVLHTLYLAGSFRSIDPHFAGSCKAVEGVTGAEDITIDPQRPVAYISAYDRRAALAGESFEGGIFRHSLEEDSASPERLNTGALSDFRPHGMDIHTDEDGQQSLFVVNHGNDEHSIEIFDLDNGDLEHRRTVRDPMLNSPNNLVAVSHEQFYVTNDHGGQSETMRKLEDYLRLPLSNVLLFDGEGFSEAATGLRFANGINQSPDGETIYVAGTTEPGIYVYERNPETNELSYHHTIELITGPDNIEVDSMGTLWVGGISRLLGFVEHVDNPDHAVPAEVVRIQPRGGHNYSVDTIYQNDGSELSASSAAAGKGSRLLIGTVFGPRFLDCEMDGIT